MLWTPDHHLLGDMTIIRVGEVYHLFSEAFPIADADADRAGRRVVIHWTSRDLLNWEELPVALECGPAGAFDAFCIYHMDVYVHDGTWYMHYTGLDAPHGPGQQQAVGLATSSDGVRWQKHPDNPVLRADLRHYEPAIPREATYQEKDFGRLWFRDPCIVRDPQTGRFNMAVVARDVHQHPDVRGCIAWAESDDLIHWEPGGPIFSPGRFHTVETPSIFEHAGRHYLIYMTHRAWGFPPQTSDPYQANGNFYAVSTSGPAGPYAPPEDEVLIACAHDPVRLGAQRTVDTLDGGRMHYGWLRAAPAADDVDPGLTHLQYLPYPKPVRFTEQGHMHVTSNPAVEARARSVAMNEPEAWTPKRADERHWHSGDGTVVGKCAGGTSLALLRPEAGDFIFAASVEFRRGDRAGLVARVDEAGETGWMIVLDRRFGRVEIKALDQPVFLDARQWRPRERCELKVIAYGMSVEVYVDDRLMLHQVRHRETGRQLGLAVEGAEARFTSIRLGTFDASTTPVAGGGRGATRGG